MTEKTLSTMQPSRRLRIRQLLSLWVIGVGGFFGAGQNVLARGNRPAPPGIHSIKREVWINGRPAQSGQLVAPGSTVTTGHGAEAIYVIGDNAFLQRENTEVRFGSDSADITKDFLRVVTGKLLSVFGKGEKTLRTPTATIGIRGTGCYIEAAEKTVYFCLCYGEAEIRPTVAPSHVERIVTRHHDHPMLIHHDQNMPMMANAKVINHTDLELTLLENLNGRWSPYSGSGYSSY